jgi:hypothetical protein
MFSYCICSGASVDHIIEPLNPTRAAIAGAAGYQY